MKKAYILLLLLSFVITISCTQAPSDEESKTNPEQKETVVDKSAEDSTDNPGDKGSGDDKQVSNVDEYANTSLQEMFDFLSKTQRIKVNVASTYDTLQRDGQLIEFGTNTEWILRRPGKVLINSVSWEGDDRTFYFDGKDITYYDSSYNVYAVAPKEGDLDQAFDYFVEKLNMPLPLTELFSERHPFDLKANIESSMYLGEATLNGVDCNEFTFRFPETDLQIWIKEGDQPLPVRMVITYKKSPGKPQYQAQFSEWDLTSVMPDRLFKFNPPTDSRKIIFATHSGKKNKGDN